MYVVSILLCNAVYPCVYREHIYYFVHLTVILGLSLCVQGTPVK